MRTKVEKLMKGKKELTLDDWIMAITTHGIPPDVIG
jgi:hypothetical protein